MVCACLPAHTTVDDRRALDGSNYVANGANGAWRGFRLDFRYHSARYEISVENPHGVTQGVTSVEIDDTLLAHSPGIPLVDDGTTHSIRVVLG